jgi:hypothetical protein
MENKIIEKAESTVALKLVLKNIPVALQFAKNVKKKKIKLRTIPTLSAATTGLTAFNLYVMKNPASLIIYKQSLIQI